MKSEDGAELHLDLLVHSVVMWAGRLFFRASVLLHLLQLQVLMNIQPLLRLVAQVGL